MIYMEYINYIACFWHSTIHLEDKIENKTKIQLMFDNDNNTHAQCFYIPGTDLYVLYIYQFS